LRAARAQIRNPRSYIRNAFQKKAPAENGGFIVLEKERASLGDRLFSVFLKLHFLDRPAGQEL